MFVQKRGCMMLDLGGELAYFYPGHPFDNQNGSILWCLETQLPAGKNFLDIGANVGSWTIPYAASEKCAHVYAWEPQVGTRECTLAGLAVNGLTRKATVFAEALGEPEQRGEMDLNIFTEEGGASSLHRDVGPGGPAGTWAWTRVEKVPVKCLDDYGLTNVGFIKLDVESNELEVLRGAVETLKVNSYPPIFFEAWDWPWYLKKKAALFAFIESLGYRIHPIIGCTADFLAVRP